MRLYDLTERKRGLDVDYSTHHVICPECNGSGTEDYTGERNCWRCNGYGTIMPRIKNISEGGWTDTVTQGTKITPNVVSATLSLVKLFINDFNKWLIGQDENAVHMGEPVGSTAYFQIDHEGKEYGDIDLQIIVPTIEGKTESQIATHYNKLADDFIAAKSPEYIYKTNHPALGHIIFQIEEDTFVQVDFMWATEKIADWARWRSTPEQGIKGLVYGSIYSSLGDTLNISISTSGAQMKIVSDQPRPFSKTRKFDELAQISLNIENFGIDMLIWMYARMGNTNHPHIDDELQQYPGINKTDIRIADLVHMIKGLAKSFELNDMYGKFNLKDYSSSTDFLSAFLKIFDSKMIKSANASKFNKAETPDAIAKVEQTREQIKTGQEMVHKLIKE